MALGGDGIADDTAAIQAAIDAAIACCHEWRIAAHRGYAVGKRKIRREFIPWRAKVAIPDDTPPE